MGTYRGQGVAITQVMVQKSDTTKPQPLRSEEHTSELQSRGLISYAVFCLKKKKKENKKKKKKKYSDVQEVKSVDKIQASRSICWITPGIFFPIRPIRKK